MPHLGIAVIACGIKSATISNNRKNAPKIPVPATINMTMHFICFCLRLIITWKKVIGKTVVNPGCPKQRVPTQIMSQYLHKKIGLRVCPGSKPPLDPLMQREQLWCWVQRRVTHRGIWGIEHLQKEPGMLGALQKRLVFQGMTYRSCFCRDRKGASGTWWESDWRVEHSGRWSHSCSTQHSSSSPEQSVAFHKSRNQSNCWKRISRFFDCQFLEFVLLYYFH